PLLEDLADEAEVFGQARRRELLHELGRAAQLDLKDDGQVAVGAEALQVVARYPAQLLARVSDLRQLLAAGGDGLRRVAVEDGAQDFFLALEVEVDRAVGHSGGARDVGDLRVEVAVAREDLRGGAHDGLALVARGGARGLRQGGGGTHRGRSLLGQPAGALLNGCSFSQDGTSLPARARLRKQTP